MKKKLFLSPLQTVQAGGFLIALAAREPELTRIEARERLEESIDFPVSDSWFHKFCTQAELPFKKRHRAARKNDCGEFERRTRDQINACARAIAQLYAEQGQTEPKEILDIILDDPPFDVDVLELFK